MARSKWNNGEWTVGRYNAFVTSALRAAARRWPPKFRVLAKAMVGSFVNAKTGRKALHYKCAQCAEVFPGKEVQVDHKKPVIAKEGFVDWDTYIDRLFCEDANLQVLCLECHKAKTNEERKQAKEIKNAKQGK